MSKRKDNMIKKRDNSDLKRLLRRFDRSKKPDPVRPTILIVDFMNLFYRNYMVNTSIDQNGYHCGGVLGSLMSIKSLVKQFVPNRIYICQDGLNSTKSRRAINEEYKTGRIGKKHSPFEENEYDMESPSESFDRQISEVKQLLEFLPIYRLEQDSLEADDIISFLWNFHSKDYKIIVSSDRDFLQLVNSDAMCFNPVSKKFCDTGYVLEKYGIHPANFAQCRAIIGDSSDNVKGIKGIAEKTIVKLFPFVKDEKEHDLDYFFEWARQSSTDSKLTKSIAGKYLDIIGKEELIRDNFKIMDLKSNRQATAVAEMIHHIQNSVFDINLDAVIDKLSSRFNINKILLTDWFLTFNRYLTFTEAKNNDRQYF